MNRWILGSLLLFVVCLVTPLRAELSLEQLQAKFEGAVEAEKLEHGVKALKLRDGYLGALERLKGTLGSEEKLEQAAQVLAEIEAVKGDAAPASLPDNADYRLKTLRNTWERTSQENLAAHERVLEGLAAKYLELLEEKKRSLTRAGDIKGALAVGKEEERVQELGFVAKSQNAGRGTSHLKGAYGKGNLALEKNGAKAVAPRDASRMIDGKVRDYERMGSYAYGVAPCRFSVELPEVYVVDSIKILLWDHDSRRYKYRVEVSSDGKEWVVVDDHEHKATTAGWKRIEFEPLDVRHVKMTGFGNSVNRDMHVVEVEVYGPDR